LYSSIAIAPIETRIQRERTEQIAALNDRLDRERRTAEEKLYDDQFQMRQVKLRERRPANERLLNVMRDQIQIRNQLLVGLFGFMERREDGYPNLGSLAQLAASLGESGSSTWQSV
jgi:1,4-alpha-glucan branching enzyme